MLINNIIGEDSLKVLFNDIIDNLNDIEYLLKEDFYMSITRNDVDFLSKYSELQDYKPLRVMKIYHVAIMYIATEVLMSVLEKRGIPLTQEQTIEICPFFQYIYNEAIRNNCKTIALEKSWVEIEELMISALTDSINLLSRKSSGTEITPRSIVEFMLDSVDYSGGKVLEKNLLEPACGTGIFLSSVIKRFLNECNNEDINYLSNLLLDEKRIVAFDINPLNVYISKIVIALNIIDKFDSLSSENVLDMILRFPIYKRDILKSDISGFDYVVGNPPYIRLQNLNLETRNYIQSHYKSATGRFDVYVCFFEAAIKALKLEGKISFITSNKYFTANYGKGIRDFIKNNVEIDFIFDLSDTKYFKAAVLPAILTGCRKENPNDKEFRFSRIRIDETKRETREKIADIFGFTRKILERNEPHEGFYSINNHHTDIRIGFLFAKVELPKGGNPWNFASESDQLIKEKLEKRGSFRLEDLFDICVGIKTTADDVFVKPMTGTFIRDRNFEGELIYPLIQSSNIEKWFIRWESSNNKDRYILYPHVETNGKTVAADLSHYPNCRKYLNENRERLESRTYLAKSKTRAWYECWVPQTLDKFGKMKIVTADIVSHNSFALDLNGELCQGNTFFLIQKTEAMKKMNFKRTEIEFFYYVLGLLNSNTLEYYHKLISGSLYSKKFRYTTSNLSRWPVPKLVPDDKVGRIIELVGLILEEGTYSEASEKELNKIVYSIYGLNKSEIKKIESFLDSNT